MAKIRNVSGNDLIVPSLAGRLVLAGQVVDVDDSDVYGFTQQTTNWEPADKPAQTVHDKTAVLSTPDEARAAEDLPLSTPDNTPES